MYPLLFRFLIRSQNVTVNESSARKGLPTRIAYCALEPPSNSSRELVETAVSNKKYHIKQYRPIDIVLRFSHPSIDLIMAKKPLIEVRFYLCTSPARYIQNLGHIDTDTCKEGTK